MGGLSGAQASWLLLVVMASHLDWTAAGAEKAVHLVGPHLQQTQS